MAHALQIDTLAFSKKLKEAGADDRLADAIVEGLTAADTSELATKSDILVVENKIDKVESGLKQDILKVENKIDKVDVDLNWIKLIGGAILAVLILPWLTELAKTLMNG